ncbi:MAG: hypothetical protein A2452_10975 [Candidatus Firestonebacteria bacterium RIFOXYC2_FULL_39_67]|nr:MAG: hypothetical protein A2536_08875 [Candidatus Firestonebacteria bacterium RIFOXYD2_FULL_39_29]OGF55977.1 MAG: hypothetical protein A2452_10975 [Candidatus Firestonebacteria bacterium RIFOXYC2_FULL_39_67]
MKTITNNWIVVWGFAICILLPGVCFGENALTFEDYLSQVKVKNPDIKSANLFIDSMGKKVLQTGMVYSPRLIGDYSFIDDRSGSSLGSTLQLNETVTNVWDLSVSKKWGSGTTTSVGYSNSINALDLQSPYEVIPGVSLSKFTAYDIQFYAKVEQSLIKDFMSKYTEAGINKNKASVKSAQYIQIYSAQQILLKARSIYLALSLSREIVNFRKAELQRAEEILKWNENRVNNDLADKADLLQAKAFFRQRQLNLQLAVEDEKKTCLNFNNMRGKSSDSVEENISVLNDIVSKYSNENLTPKGQRADVLSAKNTKASSEYLKLETEYSLLPDLNVYGKASLHGLDLSNSGAFNQAIGVYKPTYSVGINLIVPLDFSTPETVNKGYELDYQASIESLNKAEISSKNDWINLTETWKNVKERIVSSLDIKNIQTERLEYERQRFQKGRTTMSQMVNTENDLDDATLNYYRYIVEQISIYFEAELYNTQPIE